MIDLNSLTTSQLNRIVAIKEQIESLQSEMESIGNGGGKATGKKRGMSAAGRARIGAAAKARWAKLKSKKVKANAPKKRDGRSSAAARAKLSAAAKARWAKVKASGKSSL